VANLERPGGNLTGFTTFDPQEARKKLELLKEVVPGLARVAILGDQELRDTKGHLIRHHEEQARAMSLQPQSLKIAGASPDLQGVFQAMERERADALLVLELPATVAHRKRIAELAAQQRLPTFFAGGAAAGAARVWGGLVGCGGARRLWPQGHQGGAAPGGLCSPDCQGGAARRPAFRGRRAPRADRQPQDGAEDWRHDPARGAQAGG